MRALNGNGGEKFDVFWDEAALYSESISGATSTRKGTDLFAAQPVSVPDFVRQVVKRLQAKVDDDEDESLKEMPPIPTEKWVAFQFQPRHPSSHFATRHTGRLPMRRVVESRTLRDKHMDNHYALKINQHVNSFVLELKNALDSALPAADCPVLGAVFSGSLDDKSKAAVGEPDHAVDSGARAPKASLAAVDVQSKASDHGWHRASITPAVTLVQDIPEAVSSSWSRGKLCVTVRDSVFFGSTGLRHAAELLKLLKELSNGGALPFALRIKTDGGPDHNPAHLSVVLSLVALLRLGGFDAIVAHRLAPGWSFQNEAERCMSTLNLTLQHLPLERGLSAAR